jgi:mannosyltransferase OCH1-like enzyme
MPKIIHQIWLGDAPPIDLINTWKDKNPNWSHILWTEKTLQDWRFHNQDKLDLMPEPSGKCDIMRYEILYNLGGLFIDANAPCLEPLDDSLIQYDCTTILEGSGGLLNVNFLAAQPRCELMRLCIEEMDKVASPAWWYVGSAYLTYIVQKYQYRIKVFPEDKPVEFRPAMSCRRKGVLDYYGIKPRKATHIKSRRQLSSS